MMNRKVKLITRSLLGLVLAMVLATGALAADEPSRSTRELENDLRDTKREFKEFKSLQSKLESSGRQSSNASRQKVMKKNQEFMGECIQRRESDLGEEITLVQHGKMVKSGTTDVANYDSSQSKKDGSAVNNDRLRQLSNMKSIFVGAKNNAQPASERQGEAFDRYTDTFGKFGQQLQWGIDAMQQELDNREAKAQAEEKATQDSYKD